ncbi:MAG: ABC transporter substrate-binding protein [Candidatus Eremiobacteraeota bacterium]|nr:ABC transporter substrate-binding protein [Candidatus Eremiobacteraeota bacterium]
MKTIALAMLLALALEGCGGSSSGGNGGAPGGGATLVVARVKDAVGLDPSHETDGLSLNITGEVFENLVKFKPGTFEIIPSLAKSWTSSNGGKTWTFVLRPGLKFSDGTPLDAAAVKFNFDRWRSTKDPNHGTFSYGYWVSQFGGFDGKSVVSDVAAPTSDRVIFTLRTPFGPFLRDVAMPSFAIGSPTAIKADPQGFGLKPVASGPYMVAEWVKDDHITLVANPNWTGGALGYQTVIVRDIPDQSTSVLSMKKGDVDILVDPRPDDAKDLANEKGVTLYRQPSNNVTYVALNTEKKPFDNVFVRRAIAYAIDKAAIAKSFYALGAQVADNWTPPGMLGGNPSVKAYPHDVAQAKNLLAQAGFANGFSTQLFYPTSPRPYMPEPQRMAEAIQANLREVGIAATLQPLEFAVFLTKIRNGEHPMCLIGWTGDNGDPDNFMYPLLDQDSAVKPQAQNYAFWRDPAYHALMLAGQREVNESKRGAVYAKANAMIRDAAPAVPIAHSVVSFAAKSSIDGIVPRPDSQISFELMKPATVK